MKMKLLLFAVLALLLSASMAFARIGGGDISFKVKGDGNAAFSHDSHVGDSALKCTECHDSLYITKEKHKKVVMSQMQKGKSCGVCHNGKRAFDVKGSCNNCHKK